MFSFELFQTLRCSLRSGYQKLTPLSEKGKICPSAQTGWKLTSRNSSKRSKRQPTRHPVCEIECHDVDALRATLAGVFINDSKCIHHTTQTAAPGNEVTCAWVYSSHNADKHLGTIECGPIRAWVYSSHNACEHLEIIQ